MHIDREQDPFSKASQIDNDLISDNMKWNDLERPEKAVANDSYATKLAAPSLTLAKHEMQIYETLSTMSGQGFV